MANLKALRGRINSVKNTRKITAAMKMVAAAKLRRAQARAEAAKPYAAAMERMLAALAASAGPEAPAMLVGTGRERTHLLVVVTADRGLAGAFSTNAAKLARGLARRLEGEGKAVKIVAVGRKGRDFLRRELGARIVHEVSFAGIKQVGFAQAAPLAEWIAGAFARGEFDVCTLVHNRFDSVIAQIPVAERIIPTPLPETPPAEGPRALYEFEPGEAEMLERLLPRNLATQLYRAVLESAAGEQGARMTAMDNATRNAGDMIGRLTQTYNRTRQANITNELIEIISGAEAL